MSLTDPELDLLRELLEDDPDDEVFVQVGTELNRRGEWSDAFGVLRRGLRAHPDEQEAWLAMCRAALEIGEFTVSLEAWDHLDDEQQAGQEALTIRILAMERMGRTDDAKAAVIDYREAFGDDHVVVESVWERLDAPPPDLEKRARDPFLTVAVAERYAAVGRADRAIRAYRRILFANPDDPALASRLTQLDSAAFDADEFTDLSEELTDPSLVPPGLVMPSPAITSASVSPAPGRAVTPGSDLDDSSARTRSGYSPSPSVPPPAVEDFLASNREAQRRSTPENARRRKRRSLLKR